LAATVDEEAEAERNGVKPVPLNLLDASGALRSGLF